MSKGGETSSSFCLAVSSGCSICISIATGRRAGPNGHAVEGAASLATITGRGFGRATATVGDSRVGARLAVVGSSRGRMAATTAERNLGDCFQAARMCRSSRRASRRRAWS